MQKANKEPVKKKTEFCSNKEMTIATHIPMLKQPSLGKVSRNIPKAIPRSTDKQITKIKMPLFSRIKSSQLRATKITPQNEPVNTPQIKIVSLMAR